MRRGLGLPRRALFWNFREIAFRASMGPVDTLPVSPMFLGAAVIIVLGLWGWRKYYQFCPHCGALASRVYEGWKRCRRCGRQYRRGLRLR